MGMGDEAEDFAQECLIKAFEVGPVNIEFLYKNYVAGQRADKRILSAPQGAVSVHRTISLQMPIDGSDNDSACLGDFIGDTRDELGTVRELEFYDELLEGVLSMVSREESRRWAYETYMKYLKGLV